MTPTIVPTTLDGVVDPGWLQWALDDLGHGDRILAVEAVDSSKTLAQKVRLAVTGQGVDGVRPVRAYCVKAHLDGSPGADILSEALFYRDLAPRLEVRMPHAYYAAVDESARRLGVV